MQLKCTSKLTQCRNHEKQNWLLFVTVLTARHFGLKETDKICKVVRVTDSSLLFVLSALWVTNDRF